MIVTQAVILDEKRCPPGFLGTKNDLPQEIERWMDKRAISGKRSSLKRLPIIKWSKSLLNEDSESLSDISDAVNEEEHE